MVWNSSYPAVLFWECVKQAVPLSPVPLSPIKSGVISPKAKTIPLVSEFERCLR